MATQQAAAINHMNTDPYKVLSIQKNYFLHFSSLFRYEEWISKKLISIKNIIQEWNFEKNLLLPIVSGIDVKKYSPLPSRQFILYPYVIEDERAELLNIEFLSKSYPCTYKYLVENKKWLMERERGKFKGKDWHRFGRNQNIGIQGRKKICVPRLVDHLHASLDCDGSHVLDNVDVNGITLKFNYKQINLKYVLALLNSKLLQWYFPFISAPFRGGFRSANKQFLSQLPVKIVKITNSSDKTVHDKMIGMVDHMLELQKKYHDAKIETEKNLFKKQIDILDQQIDLLVYQLYGLTDDEIKIVEGDVGEKK